MISEGAEPRSQGPFVVIGRDGVLYRWHWGRWHPIGPAGPRDRRAARLATASIVIGVVAAFVNYGAIFLVLEQWGSPVYEPSLEEAFGTGAVLLATALPAVIAAGVARASSAVSATRQRAQGGMVIGAVAAIPALGILLLTALSAGMLST